MRPLAQSETAMTIAAPLAVGLVIVVLWEILCRSGDHGPLAGSPHRAGENVTNGSIPGGDQTGFGRCVCPDVPW